MPPRRFPRADIDVYSTRQVRNTLAQLQTDHRDLMKQLELKLLRLHSINRNNQSCNRPQVAVNLPAIRPVDSVEKKSSASLEPSQSIESSLFELCQSPPIFRVTTVFPDSPAESAGLCANDEIVIFGSVHSGNASPQAMKQCVENSMNRPIRVVLRRPIQDDWEPVEIQLTPAKWSGQGALGCGFVPL